MDDEKDKLNAKHKTTGRQSEDFVARIYNM